MEQGKHSQTAVGTAIFRAAHQILDGAPKVLDDPLAGKILGPDHVKTISTEEEKHRRPYLVRARTLAVMRSRFVEDELAAAMEQGVDQYVILGAGLDTSPYRPPATSRKIDIYEVDHPDTQRWKLERLHIAGIDVPANVRHVALNFEKDSLEQRLTAAGFDRSRTTFFSWLGVTYYLGDDAFRDTLRFVVSMAPGTRVIFDFGLADSELSADELDAFRAFSQYLEKNNEPWLSRFSPGNLQELLREIGFRDSFYLSRELATERYLSNRDDGLNLDVLIQMMSATV